MGARTRTRERVLLSYLGTTAGRATPGGPRKAQPMPRGLPLRFRRWIRKRRTFLPDCHYFVFNELLILSSRTRRTRAKIKMRGGKERKRFARDIVRRYQAVAYALPSPSARMIMRYPPAILACVSVTLIEHAAEIMDYR